LDPATAGAVSALAPADSPNVAIKMPRNVDCQE
jgi:hypothetical protein